jgi:pilus assembly protein CpaB
VGVAGFLFPGSHVDVLATFTLPGSSAVTQTVLQDVEVLTAGQTIEPDPQGKPQAVSVVTLLLSPEDSQKLLLTSGQGAIQFVLRSGVDQKKVEINPTRLDQLGSSAKPPVTPMRRKALSMAPPPKLPQAYTLEVIRGNQLSIQKF